MISVGVRKRLEITRRYANVWIGFVSTILKNTWYSWTKYMLVTILSCIYVVCMVLFWRRATENFENEENLSGYWNIFLSAFAGAALGNLIL